ncbi:MAG TPA: hypothetical protein GXZ35_04400 [Acholeplasmataceae bacterium]|nr:hypothetical protein [Acholeplasmataceae bacterium]
MKNKVEIEFLEGIIRQLEHGILLFEGTDKDAQAQQFKKDIKMYKRIIEKLT